MSDGAPTLAGTLVELLQARAAEAPGTLLYRHLARDGSVLQTLTRGQLARQSIDVAATLAPLAPPGSRAVLLFPGSFGFAPAFFGCQQAGVIAVPACPPLWGREDSEAHRKLWAIVREVAPRAVLSLSTLPTGVRDGLKAGCEQAGIAWIDVDRIEPGCGDGYDARLPAPHDLAYLQFTSGSTTDPKGVLISHANVLSNLACIRDGAQVDAQSSVASWLPCYHDMGLVTSLLSPLYDGFAATLMSPIDFLQSPLTWLSAISRYRVTHAGGPNFAFDLCAQAVKGKTPDLDLSAWRVAFNGSEPVRYATLQRFAAAFEPYGFDPRSFVACYGLAEATLGVCYDRARRGPRLGWLTPRRDEAMASPALTTIEPAVPDGPAVVCNGVPGAGQTVAIADPATGEPCPEGVEGEIWITGGSVGLGYWQRPDETERTFGAQLPGDPRRYLRTGDLGCLHGGELYVTGRLKDLMIIAGRNVHPADVEATLEGAHPGLRPQGSAVFTETVDGEPRMVVVAEAAMPYAGDEHHGAMTTAIRHAIASRHDLRPWAVVLVGNGSVPRTSSGKVRRQRCRADLADGRLPVLNAAELPRFAADPRDTP
ncbi:MAG: fatty acyl-AMP ligase [Proteobacteria bacterium]|nr:fatty acyl-AMP ligase [Pseudomonadota bacterium]